MKNIKVKPLTINQILISIDRLTRFKHPEVKYLRVFRDILMSNLIYPKFKKSDLENMDYSDLKEYAEYIINYSLEFLGKDLRDDFLINQRLLDYEKKVYYVDSNVERLLENKINYKACLDFISENSPKNLKWLKVLSEAFDIESERKMNSLRFPVEKVVIAEGATEEILLPEFAKRCGFDFDKEGIYILSAGGKNQVVKLYYQLVESLRIPIFVLLDKDAEDNLKEIKPKLRNIDKIHLLACGEFEDLLPKPLLFKTLEYGLKNISMLDQESISNEESTVKFLEEVFRTRGMHEFKKVEFAQMVKENIKTEEDISPEILEIIEEIRLAKINIINFKENS